MGRRRGIFGLAFSDDLLIFKRLSGDRINDFSGEVLAALSRASSARSSSLRLLYSFASFRALVTSSSFRSSGLMRASIIRERTLQKPAERLVVVRDVFIAWLACVFVIILIYAKY